MLEGLAVWALFIYLLRLVGMPWNKGTKTFAYLGGTGWLLFVWVGLLNYTPMDLSGGSFVQSPHIQLRPGFVRTRGYIEKMHVEPNQRVEKGQLIYELDDEEARTNLERAKSRLDSDKLALSLLAKDILLSEEQFQTSLREIEITERKLHAAEEDLDWKQTTLKRYLDQNAAVAHSITESRVDAQRTATEIARVKVLGLQSELAKVKVDKSKAELAREKAQLAFEQQQVEVDGSVAVVERKVWELKRTKVHAPADGYLTNFTTREGQYIARMPRMHMYTDEKYVMMRVNHQAIRNIKVGDPAEFASAVYPGKIFQAEVEGIIEATGESQRSLLSTEESVSATTVKNVKNKYHFVRLKLVEPEGFDIPVGATGLAWVSGEKPIGFLGFLDVIRGIIIRMKSQIYYFHTL